MPMNHSLELGPTGDIVMDVEDDIKMARMVTGIKELEQALSIRIRTVQGEMELHPDAGLPTHQIIGLYNADFISAVVRATVEQEPRIQRITRIDVALHRETRTSEVTMQATSVDGFDVSLEESL